LDDCELDMWPSGILSASSDIRYSKWCKADFLH